MMHSYDELLTHWYRKTPGKELLQIEKQLLLRTLSNSSGCCFLHWSTQDRYDLNMQVDFEQHIYLSLQHDFPLFARGLHVEVDALPFLKESIDLIIFPHFLEFIADPFSLLKESYRILKPGGCLLILNFNPVSFWGLGKFSHKRNDFPWNGRPISALYLRCFLARLGLSVIEYKTDFFRPLFADSKKLESYLAFETIGQLCWPFLGAVYMMLAKKESLGMTSIKTKNYSPPPIFGLREGQMSDRTV